MPIASAHSTELYTILRGIVYISNYGAVPSWSDLGNCVEMSAELTVDRLEHKTNRARKLVKDKEIVVETGYTVKFVLDEFSQANLAKFFMGTESGRTIRALQNLSQEYSLKFETNNQAGPNERYIFHRCQISPDGSIQLLSTANEWAKMAFIATGLDDTAYNPLSPMFSVDMITTSSTTSSSSTTTTTASSSSTTTTTA